MSSEIETDFPQGRRIITIDRNRLSTESLKSSLFYNHWLDTSVLDIQLRHEPHNDTKDTLNEYAFSAPFTHQEVTTQHMLAWSDQHGHPQLKQMAFDLLSIPATSCDLERIFSSTGRLIDATMSRITDETIEMRQCVCSWLKDNLIELQIS